MAGISRILFCALLLTVIFFCPSAHAVTVDAVDISNPACRQAGAQYSVNVLDISNRLYLKAVLNELNNAKQTINVAMYSAYVRIDQAGSPAGQLVQALIAAKARGVSVRVYLDNSDPGDKGNEAAYLMLDSAGIDVSYIKPGFKLHAKLIVIDDETVINGSANWTDNAILSNFESNTLLRSKEFAQQKAGFFVLLAKNAAPRVKPAAVPSVRVSNTFLTNGKFIGAIVEASDRYAFDLYLLLLRRGVGWLPIDYQKTAQYLGIKVDTRSGNYKRDLNIIIKKLKEKYGLIDYRTNAGGDTQVRLVDYLDPAKDYTTPQSGYFNLPCGYWDYGLDRQLLLREKVAYLVCLREQALAWPKPFWQFSEIGMEKTYHVERDIFSLGFQALKKEDLLEIIPSIANDEKHSDREPNHYRVKPLVSPQEKERQCAALEKSYGANTITAARALAQVFEEDNDGDSVEALAVLIKRYSLPKVKAAVAKIAGYSNGNPLKNIAHVAAILGEGGDE